MRRRCTRAPASESGARILTDICNRRKEHNDDRYRAPSELEVDNSYSAVLRESCTKAVKMLYQEPVVLVFSLWIS